LITEGRGCCPEKFKNELTGPPHPIDGDADAA
jgi:hypothetical protein